MKPTEPAAPQAGLATPDLEALLCALVLAPRTYARNQFFRMYEQPAVARVRRRAARVRGVIRQLIGDASRPGSIVGEQVFDDLVLLRYAVESIHYARTTSLSPLEAALVHYALHTATGAVLALSDREQVETALARLGSGSLPPDWRPALSAGDAQAPSNQPAPRASIDSEPGA